MARRGRKSIVFEVKEVINELNRIGSSKREDRTNGNHRLHPIKSVRDALSVNTNFVKWVRSNYSLKSIYQLTEEHYISYIDSLIAKGLSTGHI